MKTIGRISVLAIVIIGTLSFTMLFTGCESKDEDVIRIGAILPLTGQLSYLGSEEKNVLMLLEDSINRLGEKKIKFYIEDSRGTARDGISAYQKLRNQGIEYYITSLTIVGRSVAPLIDRNGHTQFVLSIDPDITSDYNNTFRVYYDIKQEMQLTAQYLNHLNSTNVASLYINTPESKAAITIYLRNFLNKYDISLITTETYGFDDRSTRNQLLKLRNAGAEHITTIDFGYMYPIILREAEELNIRKRIIGGLGMMTAPKIDPKLTSGVTFFCSSFILNPSDDYLRFKNEYSERYNEDITFNGIYLHDAVNILLTLIKSNGEYEAIINEAFYGISGKIVIDNTKSSTVDITAAKYLDDGSVVEVIF